MINKIISASAIVIAVGFGIYGYMNDLEVNQKMQKFMNTGPRYTAQDGERDRRDRRQADQELCERIAKLERAVAGTIPFYDIHPLCSYDEPSEPTDLRIMN